jgi:hypothetical protein
MDPIAGNKENKYNITFYKDIQRWFFIILINVQFRLLLSLLKIHWLLHLHVCIYLLMFALG